jgi:NAD(P)-dependent dehydrogenase (short-subunit alcohol dehydrogenase family)
LNQLRRASKAATRQNCQVLELPKTPSFRLDGRRALVTGGSRGIGLACAAALTQAGSHVTICARQERELQNAADAIRGSGGQADVLSLDITDTRAVRHVIGAEDAYDILVNSAGTNRPMFFGDVAEEDYDAVLDLNLRANFFVAQTVAQKMIAANRKGTIIQMSSQMGHVGGARRTLYCASKWAVEGLTKAMAIDLAPHGIRVNAVAPTFIETPMTAPFLANQEFRNQVIDKIKLGRLGRVEDLMGVVVFLASEAATLITGTSILVDGGWTAD